jgi:hypothetical protein
VNARWRGLGLAAAALLLATIPAACGHGAYSSAAPDVKAAVSAAGGEVTAEGTAPNRYPGGSQGSWYAVSRPGATESGALVGVLPFDSQAARDRAYTTIQYRANRLAYSVVFTWGDAVVVVTHIDDWGLLQDLTRQFEKAGAG